MLDTGFLDGNAMETVLMDMMNHCISIVLFFCLLLLEPVLNGRSLFSCSQG